jgi:CheY-like chemotaxis protein
MSWPARVLLVDDNVLDIELTLDALRGTRLANLVHVAVGGQAALDYLLDPAAAGQPSPGPLPGLVLLDLKMPGVDGFEVLRRVKAAPILRRVPVVVFTSSQEEADLARSYDLGANSYLVKPALFEDLLQTVREIERYWIALNVPPPPAALPETP